MLCFSSNMNYIHWILFMNVGSMIGQCSSHSHLDKQGSRCLALEQHIKVKQYRAIAQNIKKAKTQNTFRVAKQASLRKLRPARDENKLKTVWLHCHKRQNSPQKDSSYESESEYWKIPRKVFKKKLSKMTFMRTVLTLCKWGKIAWYFMVPGCIDTIGMILSDWCHISAGRVKNLKWPCCDLQYNTTSLFIKRTS